MKTKSRGIILFLLPALITALVSCVDPVGSIDPVKIPVKMTISSPPDKLVYELNESPDWTGLRVLSTCVDGSTRVETIGNGDISGFDSSTTGAKTVTVTKNGLSATFTVTVIPALKSLSISTYPDKLVYEVGESPDLTGLVVIGSYSDGNTKIETIGEDDISGFDSATPGVQTITIAKRSRTVTFTVEVLDRGSGSVTILPPSSAADITLSRTGNVVTASDGYSGYQWFVDDLARPADGGSDGKTITLSTPAYSLGTHRVRVTAYKQGLPYSGETTITLPIRRR